MKKTKLALLASGLIIALSSLSACSVSDKNQIVSDKVYLIQKKSKSPFNYYIETKSYIQATGHSIVSYIGEELISEVEYHVIGNVYMPTYDSGSTISPNYLVSKDLVISYSKNSYNSYFASENYANSHNIEIQR